jgi:hypothetical protein
MKLKRLSFPLIVSLVLTATACSSGSTSSKETQLVAKPLTKNAALPVSSTSSKQTQSNGVLTPHTPKDNSATKTNTTVGVSIQSTGNPVLIPSDFCKLISVNCASLDFAQVEVTGAGSFIATAVIPNTSVKLPAGEGFTFEIIKTSVKVVANAAESNFSVIADTKLSMKGHVMQLLLTGRYTPVKNTIEIELTNPNVGLNNFLGIAGFNISSVTGKVSFVGATPAAIGFAVSGTLPTFLKEMGVNPGTQVTVAFETGTVGFTMGMSVGSQATGSPNIFNIQNVLSARYLAFSFSTIGSTIADVYYPLGFALAFDGKFGTTSVVVKGVVTPLPVLAFDIDFAIGAFTLGGFEFEESMGTIARSNSKNILMFQGGLAGYGVQGRMKGTFDVAGGIELIGEGGFMPAGVNLGSFKYKMVANTSGFEFTGTNNNNYGVVTGTTAVGFRAFAGKKIAFDLGIGGGLRIPGVPSYGSVEGSLNVTNCPNMTCSSPTASPTATITGTSSFYGQARQSFSATVNPNNWTFNKELSFNYNKNLNYVSNGFAVSSAVSGAGSVTISNTGITFGNGSLRSSAGFNFPSQKVPAVTVPDTKVEECKKVLGKKVCVKVKVPGYTVTPGYTIPGGRTNLSSSVGKDTKGYYVDVVAGSGVKGSRLYFS